MSMFKPLNINDLTNWNAVRPKKRKKPGGHKSDHEENSFEALNDDEEDHEEVMEEGETPVMAKEKKLKIPPIVIYASIENHKESLDKMQAELKEDITIKYKLNRVVIYTKNEEDYNKLRAMIVKEKIDYHTYTLAKEKPVVSILKGLPSNVKISEIKAELDEVENLEVLEVKQFIKKVEVNGKSVENKLPIFSVKFSGKTKVADFKKIRKLCYCKITWEKNTTASRVIQCYKCWSYGHIATNCFRREVCSKCAQNHETKMCKETSENLKCINCGGQHLANDTRCDIYCKVAERKEMRTRNFGTFINGPGKQSARVNTEANNRNSTPIVGARSYSQVTSGLKNHKQQQSQGFDGSIGGLFNELKDFLSSFDIPKLLFVFQKTVANLKNCKDGISKFSCIVEGIFEFFN